MENIYINTSAVRIFSYFNNEENKPSALDLISGLSHSLLNILDTAIIDFVYKTSLNLS